MNTNTTLLNDNNDLPNEILKEFEEIPDSKIADTIVINEKELESHIIDIWKHLPENKVLLDHFLDDL